MVPPLVGQLGRCVRFSTPLILERRFFCGYRQTIYLAISRDKSRKAAMLAHDQQNDCEETAERIRKLPARAAGNEVKVKIYGRRPAALAAFG
jgi:hypothetical protein